VGLGRRQADAAKKLSRSKSRKDGSAPNIGSDLRAKRTVTCRVQPTREQHKKLLLWCKAVRGTYNRMAAECNETHKERGKFPTPKELRALFVNAAVLVGELEWLKDVPYDVRDRATLDIQRGIAGHRTRVAKWQAKCAELKAKCVEKLPDRPRCQFKFRSRHNNQVLEINHRDWNRTRGAYTDIFAPDKLACKSMRLPAKMAADFKVVYDRRKRWRLHLPVPRDEAKMELAPERQRNAVVALDPGVR
jgi:hypothetical protein